MPHRDLDDVRRRYEGLFESVNAGIGIGNIDGYWLEINDALCNMLDYSRQEMLAMTFRDITHPDDIETSDTFRNSALAGRASRYAIKKRLRKRGGGIIWCNVSVNLRRDAQGVPVYFVMCIIDINDMATAQQELADREEQLRATFENAAVGIVLTSETGVFIKVNQRFCEMIGYDRSQLEGQNFRLFTHPDDLTVNKNKRSETFGGKRKHAVGEKRWLRNDGTALWCRITMAVQRPSPPKEPYSIAIVEDIQLEKKMEAARQLLIGELNHRVKNTLAVVQGVVQQTLATKPNPQEFAAAIDGRLTSLAKAHDLLNEASWKELSLSELVVSALQEPFAAYWSRIQYQGVSVILRAQQTIVLSLILHELATNAVKHGSLATANGIVRIICRVEVQEAKETVILDWCESGGRSLPPTKRKGFGSFILSRGAEFSLSAKTQWDLTAEGLAYHLEFPLGGL